MMNEFWWVNTNYPISDSHGVFEESEICGTYNINITFQRLLFLQNKL